MNKIRIAVTGVGGGVGQSIVKSLYDSDYGLVGLDGELHGTGLYAVPHGIKIPYAKSSEFVPALLEICRKEEIGMLFPGLDAELMPLSLHKSEFEKIGTTVVVSDPSVVALSDDKLLTSRKLSTLGMPAPMTMELSGYGTSGNHLKYPIIVKQKVGGARSKNVYLFKDKGEFEDFISIKDLVPADYVIQEFISGDEYTCGSITLDGKCRGVIVMQRVLRDGDTYKCFSMHNEIIESHVRKLVQSIGPFGACNVQLRLRDNIPYVFEINARCSGTTAARAICGFNEPRMIADYIFHGTEPRFEIRYMAIMRYWKELVVPNDRIDQIGRDGSTSTSLPPKL